MFCKLILTLHRVIIISWQGAFRRARSISDLRIIPLTIFFCCISEYVQGASTLSAALSGTSPADATDPRIIAAIITAVASAIIAIASAIWSYYTTRKNQMDLAEMKVAQQERQAERDARRDYEYEARKRLYEQYEPLLFQLVELSEDALYRVYSLARSARTGHLTEAQGGWMSAPDYYLLSTIYKLLAPIVIFKLMRRRLTLVDVNMDARIGTQYTFAKILYLTFTCDYEMAKMEPVLAYKPNVNGWAQLRQTDPRQYWRQGLALGRLDNALDDLLIEKNGVTRLRTFGEYQTLFYKRLEDDQANSYSLTDIFHEFHPHTRPALWRVLITQAHIHRMIVLGVGRDKCEPLQKLKKQMTIPKNQRLAFDWREKYCDVPDSVALEEPFNVAESFIANYLATLFPYAALPEAGVTEQSAGQIRM